MKKPIEEDYRYPTTGNASAIDYAEYSSDLELYIKHMEEKHNNDIHDFSNCSQECEWKADTFDNIGMALTEYCEECGAKRDCC